jgi:flagellar hook-associated protein 2
LDPLRTVDIFQTRTAKSSDDTVFTASVATSAAAGSYDIEVIQIAKAHQIASNAYATGSTHVVGTGSLTVTVGTTSMALEIGSNNNTVAGIRDAINSASNNPGVRASIVLATDGAHLVLTSTGTGAAKAIEVAQSGGDGGLASLVYDPPGSVANYTVLAEAQDSIVEVAGFSKQSSTNTVDGMIEGVTLTLKAEAVGVIKKLDVTYNSAAAIDKVKGFVTQYNALATQIGKLRSYDASTRIAGPLLGDALLNSVEGNLRRGISTPVAGLTGDYTTLASIGLKTAADGTLTLDTAKLQKALDADFNAVGKIFGSTGGVAARLYTQIDPLLASNGQFAVRSASLDKSTKDAEQQLKILDARMQQIGERYQRQFGALDSMLSKMQTTSSFLSQQLSSLNGTV